jgi:predicted Zn-dependent protease
VYFIEFDGAIFRVLGYSTSNAWGGYSGTFRTSAESFGRLTDPSALRVQPLTLTLVTTDRDMTLEEFAARFPSQVDVDQLALLNRRRPDETIPAGTTLKRVVGGPVR